jgi:hypothetical protein
MLSGSWLESIGGAQGSGTREVSARAHQFRHLPDMTQVMQGAPAPRPPKSGPGPGSSVHLRELPDVIVDEARRLWDTEVNG